MSGFERSDPPFILERRFRAPRARVFAAWTDTDQLRNWFGPKGVQLSSANMDLRPGGRFHYCMTLPDGGAMWGKWEFQEVAPGERLVSIVGFSDPAASEARAPWDANWPMQTRSVVTFRDEGDETVMRIDWRAHGASETERRTFTAGHESMRQGWTGTLDRLEEHLARVAGGSMGVVTYINLNGRCDEALRFYEQALGAKVQFRMTFGESPMAERTPPEGRNKIMHSSFTLFGSTIMASDGMPGSPETLSGFSLSLAPSDAAEAERLFNALAEGGSVRMPLQETFWAERFGMLTDRFGVPWMVNCEGSKAQAR